MTDPGHPRPGETVVAYIRRMHGRGGCTCPRAYSRCKWAVIYDDLRGDHSMGHGGWGWYRPCSEGCVLRSRPTG